MSSVDYRLYEMYRVTITKDYSLEAWMNAIFTAFKLKHKRLPDLMVVREGQFKDNELKAPCNVSIVNKGLQPNHVQLGYYPSNRMPIHYNNKRIPLL